MFFAIQLIVYVTYKYANCLFVFDYRSNKAADA